MKLLIFKMAVLAVVVVSQVFYIKSTICRRRWMAAHYGTQRQFDACMATTNLVGAHMWIDLMNSNRVFYYPNEKR